MSIADGPMTVNEFVGQMQAFADRLATDSFAEPLERCKSILAEGIAQIFNDKEGSAGDPWPAHAPATIEKYGPHPLLVLSGKLRDSVTGSGEGHIEQISDRTLTWGTEVFYAQFHQLGTSRMPQREFLYITDTMLDGCRQEIVDYLESEIIG